MNSRPSMEIVCAVCGRESLAIRQPVYEGFKKTGEVFTCASCGHVYENEADVPFKDKEETPKIFTEADRDSLPEIFDEKDDRRLCRHCAHYVINPFTQWCGLHRKEVEATDFCEQFKEK